MISAEPRLTYFRRGQETFLELSILFFYVVATKKRTYGIYIQADDPVIWCEYRAGVQEQ